MVKKFYFTTPKKELPFSANGLAVAPGCLEFVAECDLVAEAAESVVPAVDPKNIGYTLYIWYTLTNTQIKFDTHLIINFTIISLNFASNNISR